MTFAELVSATATVAGGGPPGDWFRASAVGRVFAAQFDAQRAVIVRAPAESTALGRLMQELAEEDAIHDREVRFGVGLLEVIAEYHWHAETRVDAAMMQALLFPDGAALVNKSYAEEAGRGAARESVMSTEVRAKLATFPVPTPPGGPAEMNAWMDTNLQPSSANLGTLLAARGATATGDTPTPAELLEAKRSFIATVTQIFATFRTIDSQLTPTDRVQLDAWRSSWSEIVRAATKRAAERRAARARAAAVPPPAGPGTPTA